MAFEGDFALWADFFPNGLIPEILEAILKCWDRLREPQSDEHEEPITRRLREELRTEKDCRQLPFTVWPESSETDPVSGREIGRIDLRFLHGYREDVYLAFECKRLRIMTQTGEMRANTSEYVGENGMMRHVSGKYSQGLKDGGMIGYVMYGRVSDAKVGVKRAILKAAKDLLLSTGTSLEPSGHHPKEARIAESRHVLPDRLLLIHHIFLDGKRGITAAQD